MKKKTLYPLLVVFIVFLGWRIVTLFTGGKGEEREARPPVAVQVDSVQYTGIKQTRQFTGSIHPLYRYMVSPKVSGRILRIHKRIGDWVDRDEIIASLDAAEYEQAVIEAEANLRIAKASLLEAKSQYELARQELDRVKSLQQKGIASPSELDATTSTFEAQSSRLELANAQVEQREASLKSAQIRLSYTILKATEPGYIGERFVDEGGLIATNSPIVSVIGYKKVIVQTSVVERDYALMKEGQEAQVEVDAYPGRFFPGIVTRIAPMLQETSRVAQLEVEVDNDSLILKPGMFTHVRVVLAEKNNVCTVPRDAVVNHNGETGVYLVDVEASKAKFVPVVTGISQTDIIEIVDPPLQGLVVVLGQHLLEDGSPVNVIDSQQ